MKLSLIILLVIVATNLFASNLLIETKTYNEQNEEYIINIKYTYICDATKFADEVNLKIKDMIDFRVKSFKESLLKSKPASISTLDGKAFINLNNKNIFSGEIYYYQYDGGFHPVIYTDVFNYDVSSIEKINIQDIFGSDLEPIKKEIVDRINKEKIKRGEKPIDGFYLGVFMDRFSLNSYGIKWFFDAGLLGAFKEGAYNVEIDYDTLSKYFSKDCKIKSFVDNKLARVNLRGSIVLDDKKELPNNAKCVMQLVSDSSVLDEFDVVLPTFEQNIDLTGLDTNKKYEIITEILFDDVVAYRNTNKMPVDINGWNNTEVVLHNIFADDIKNNKLENIGYMRIAGKVGYLEPVMLLSSVLEFRLMDKDKVVCTKSLPFECNNMNYDITFPTKDLENKDYNLVILLKEKDTYLFKSMDDIKISKTNWNTPIYIRLYKETE